MNVALHWEAESFAEKWEHSLIQRKISFDRISAYDDNVLELVKSYDLVLWNWTLHDPAALIHARSILNCIAGTGVSVFPDHQTSWHYDDKVAQKYLLESIGAPIVPTHVFYVEDTARDWLETAHFPLVFKLRRGAGSRNVRLVKDKATAHRMVHRMFGRGEIAVPGYLVDASTKLRRIQNVGDVVSRLVRLPTSLKHIARERRIISRESGYILFQEYQPNNQFDTRIIVIGDKAFGLRRHNRPGDFRASGSGYLDYDAGAISIEAIAIAFDVSHRLNFQCMAYDFLTSRSDRPLICEISYCFTPGDTYWRCEGYWDKSLAFHEGHQFLEDVILDHMLRVAHDAPRWRSLQHE